MFLLRERLQRRQQQQRPRQQAHHSTPATQSAKQPQNLVSYCHHHPLHSRSSSLTATPWVFIESLKSGSHSLDFQTTTRQPPLLTYHIAGNFRGRKLPPGTYQPTVSHRCYWIFPSHATWYGPEGEGAGFDFQQQSTFTYLPHANVHLFSHTSTSFDPEWRWGTSTGISSLHERCSLQLHSRSTLQLPISPYVGTRWQ